MTTRELAAAEPRRRQYRFGEFVLDLDGGFLRRDGDEVPLRPKTFDVLKHLVQHHGKLISKNELVEAVWPNTAVTDNSLSQCMFEIRRAIGDDEQMAIRTVARRGYVFDAPVAMVFGDVPPPTAGRDAESIGPVVSDATAVPPSARHRDPMPPALRSRLLRPRPAGTALIAVLVLGAVVVVAIRSQRSTPSAVEPPVQLTDFNDSAVSPSLSHDGRMLTFIRAGYFGTTAAPRGQVYVKVLPDGAPIQLTSDDVTKDHPVFSPDDSRIVYTTLMSGLRWDSSQVPVFGGTPQLFLPNASGVVWLTDQRLVYSTIMAGIHMGIASSTESRSEYRDIYFPAREDGMAHRSAPSPDGKSLLVVEMTGGTWLPCRLLPLDGASIGRTVGPPDGQCTSASWSPDGRWMYFSSNAGGEFHIWRQRYPDGVPDQITFGPTEQEGTAITADGKYLITSMGLQQASIWLHGPDGERRLTDERYAVQPTIAPSGDHLFYLVRTRLSRGQASGELWSLDLTSGNRRRVLPGFVMANYSLSHDGNRVVFTSSENDEGDGIWIADLERRSPPRRLFRGTDIRAFSGEPGEIVYLGEDGFLYRMKDDGSGTEKASADPVAYLSTVSPDGRWAVVIRPNAPTGVGTTSLEFVSLKGEKSFAVCNDSCSLGPRSFLGASPFAWSADGKQLFVNLVHFGRSTPRTVVLPYHSDRSPETLWPRGLRLETEVAENPGAKVINAAYTFPASTAAAYLALRTSTQSNLYRVRIPE